MKVVSNASPLISMARIGQIDLLRQLFGELIIPTAVWHEIVVQGAGKPGASIVESADWIKTQPVADRLLAQALQQELDAGEAEAIILSIETKADLILMDERIGRETARYLGLHCIGLMGVFALAKRQGLIETIKPQLDTLRDAAGFRIDRALYERVLQDAGEA